MGGSQSKFKPEPHDAWYKMKVTGSQPIFLQSVLQALVDLKESQGSSQGQIIGYIQSIINENQIRPRPRNLAMQVKRALKYAVHNGFVRQYGGKFFMALTDKEFAIFKGVRPDDPIKNPVRSNKQEIKPKRIRQQRSNIPRRRYNRNSNFSETEDVEYTNTKKRKKHRYQCNYDSDYDSDESLNSENIGMTSVPSSSTNSEGVCVKRKKRRRDSFEITEPKVVCSYSVPYTSTSKNITENSDEKSQKHQEDSTRKNIHLP